MSKAQKEELVSSIMDSLDKMMSLSEEMHREKENCNYRYYNQIKQRYNDARNDMMNDLLQLVSDD